MVKTVVGLFIVLQTIFLGACNLEDMAHKIMPDEIEAEFERLIEATVAKDKEALFANAHSFFSDEKNVGKIDEVLSYARGNKVLDKTFVSSNWHVNSTLGSGTTKTYVGGYEVETDEAFLFLSYTLQDTGNGPVLINIDVNTNDVSYIEQASFAAAKTTLSHFIILVLGASVLIFIVVTLYFAARSKGLKRKWAWLIFIALGIHGVQFNWSTGEIFNSIFTANNDGVHFSIFQFMLLGVGIEKSSLINPWIISVFFPLGAVVFWLRHGHKRPWKAGIAQAQY